MTTRAYLAQRDIRSQQEYQANQTTVVADFLLLVRPATTITAESTVIGPDGIRYRVIGEVADRQSQLSGAVLYRAAWLQLVSDWQGVR
ncbi:hypothetical protein ACWEV3_40970 [Saccharopolyspora sp. NPDC003752]